MLPQSAIADSAELERAVMDRCAQPPTASRRQWFAVCCRAPLNLGSQLLDANTTETTSYFQTPPASANEEGIAYVGLGSAVRLRFAGETRFLQAGASIAEAFAEVECPSSLKSHLRFVGGGAFRPHRESDERCWESFGDATFILPQLTYLQGPGEAFWILLVDRQAPRAALDLFEQATAGHSHLPPAHLAIVESTASPSRQVWENEIARLRDDMAQGELLKVVAARRVTLELTSPPSLAKVISALNASAVDCARFALRIGERAFVGATPERLIKKQGSHIETEALAGTIDAHKRNAASQLLHSEKDLAEHHHVVQAIEETLEPLCERLERPAHPDTHSLRHIIHLRTPFSGRLKNAQHVLTLVQALHPTPAVGGVPRQASLDWIHQHEPTERGWYAAPFGVVDSEGDGEFVVALRSALIRGQRVHLYAGAGIVADSVPKSEFAETELKMSSILGALGLAG